MKEVESIEILREDGVKLGGHLWRRGRGLRSGTAIVNPATGVLARYYHAYARFLADHGFDVLTYDYRGIGASRPKRLRGCGFRWRDWGELDFDAVFRRARVRNPDGPLVGRLISCRPATDQAPVRVADATGIGAPEIRSRA